MLREKEHGWNALEYRRILRNDNHLIFGIFGDEDCQVIAFEDGEERELKGALFHQVSRRWYRARVSVRGNRILCTLHDLETGLEVVHLQTEDKDNLHPKGQVGFGTESSSYRFRNIRITSPDNKILWEGPPDRLTGTDGKVIWSTP